MVPEKVERTLISDSSIIDECFVFGDSLQNFCVAVVVVNMERLLILLRHSG